MRNIVSWREGTPTTPGPYRVRYTAKRVIYGWRYWDGQYWLSLTTNRFRCVQMYEAGMSKPKDVPEDMVWASTETQYLPDYENYFKETMKALGINTKGENGLPYFLSKCRELKDMTAATPRLIGLLLGLEASPELVNAPPMVLQTMGQMIATQAKKATQEGI